MKNAIVKSLASLTVLGIVSCSPEFVATESLNDNVRLPDAKLSIRSSELMNQTMSTLTGVRVSDLTVDNVMDGQTVTNPGNVFSRGAGGGLRQELPSNNNLGEFNSSHQGAIVRMASEYCDKMVEKYYTGARPFPDGGAAPTTVADLRVRLETHSNGDKGIIANYYEDFWGACANRPELPEVEREVAGLIGELDREINRNDVTQTKKFLKVTCSVFLSSSCVTMF